MDSPTLQIAIDNPTEASRALLFAHLANAKAAVRAKAAEGLLRLYAHQEHREGLARDFGADPEAILTRILDDLRELIAEPRTEAWTRFVNSLEMTSDGWHDGEGYDLDALKAMSEIERGAIRELIKTRLGNPNRSADWRDMEAAKALDQTAAIQQLTSDEDPAVRLQASELLSDDDAVAIEITRTLRESHDRTAVSRALDRVPDHPTAEVKAALIERVHALDSHFINAAMVLLEAFGNVADTWAERPFLFRVQEEGASGPLMQELLARVESGE
jgi:hypothetical protein